MIQIINVKSFFIQVFSFLYNTIGKFFNFIFQHIILSLIILAIFGILLMIHSARAPKRQYRKNQRKTQRIYRKAERQQNRAIQRDLRDLANTCYQVIDMISERIRVEENDTNLTYLRDQYYTLWDEIKNNRPATNTPEELLELYLQDNNDTSSPLYSKMRELVQQYWNVVGR